MSSTLFFPAAMSIDSFPLTDQGRAPVQKTRDERSTTVELANGDRKKYIKAIKHTFATSWTWLPDTKTDTIDGYAGRQDMIDIFGDSGASHVLKFYDRNAGWQEFTVYVTAYEETLKRRDPVTGVHFWDITVTFEEK